MLIQPLPTLICRLISALILPAANPIPSFTPQIDPRPFDPGETHSSTGGCKLHGIHRILIFNRVGGLPNGILYTRGYCGICVDNLLGTYET